MRQINLIIVAISLILGIVIFTQHRSFQKRHEIEQDFQDQNKNDPFGLGPVPEVELSEGLIEAIEQAEGHLLAYLSNDRSKSIYVIDLDEEVMLGKVILGGDSRGGVMGYGCHL